MTIEEPTKNRLHNWKFGSALDYAKVQTPPLHPDEFDVVEALAMAYGNVGWFEGNHGVIVQAVVRSLIGEDAG